MPEVLTKHPKIVRKILQETGRIECGREPRRILKECPLEWFCRLPTGELCIYGPENWSKMTQMDPRRLISGPEPRNRSYRAKLDNVNNRKRNYKCGKCGKCGHNRRTCSKRR